MVRKFQVMYGRMNTRVHKTFEKDGTLILSGNELTLRDEDGFYECSTLFLKDSMKLKEDSIIIIEPKEVQILRELTKDPPQKTESPPEQHHLTYHSDFVPVIKKEREHEPHQVTEKEPEMEHRPIVVKEEPDDKPQLKIAGPEITRKVMCKESLQREELMLFIKPTEHQIKGLTKIYKELALLPRQADPLNLLSEIQDICNGPIDIDEEVSCKMKALLGIIGLSLERQESILIAVDDEHATKVVIGQCAATFKDVESWLATDCHDIDQVAEQPGSKIVIIPSHLLSEAQSKRLYFDRSFVYEHLPLDEDISLALIAITRGPTYYLITCGTVEERLLQLNFKIVPDTEEGLLRLRQPGKYTHPDTHILMMCDCRNAEENGECSSKRIKFDEVPCALRDDWEHNNSVESSFQVSESLVLNLINTVK